MHRSMLGKIGILIVVSLMLLIPLMLIEGKVSERKSYLHEVKRAVETSWTGEQTLNAPLLVYPYEQTTDRNVTNQAGYIQGTQPVVEKKYAYISLDDLTVTTHIVSSLRSKGIYSVPVYTAAIELKGELNRSKVTVALEAYRQEPGFSGFKRPYLSLAFSDPRGLDGIPKIQLNGRDYLAQAGSGFSSIPGGINVMLNDETIQEKEVLSLELSMALRGLQVFKFNPLANNVAFSIEADWPHPEFIGAFLPHHRDISAEGFNATWKVNQFNTGGSAKMERCANQDCQQMFANAFGVNLFESVDVYQQTERAIKYAMLFIIVSFVAFFVFEALKNLRIHPIQYTLVGLSIAIFYLLLIALSEHLPFVLAYSIATSACVALIGFYLRFVLRGWSQSLGFSAALAALYVMLFVILQMEDFALLTGAVLTFSMLAGLMYSTRQIDWYQLATPTRKEGNTE
ncbi:MAG: inner membrane protein [Flavobacteriales bacterium]|jgi:inner membrane protein